MKKSLFIVAAVFAASTIQAQEKAGTDSSQSVQTKITKFEKVGKQSKFERKVVLHKALNEKQLRSAAKENAIKPDEADK